MTFEPAGNYFFRWLCPESQLIILMGLWDFAWWVYQEVNFSPRITQITLIFFSREFALFAVDFGLTMRNPKEPS